MGWVGLGWVGGDFCVVGLVWCSFGWLHFRHHHQRPWASRPVPVASSLAGGFCADLLRWQFHCTLSKPRQSVSFWNHSYMSFISFASCSLSYSCWTVLKDALLNTPSYFYLPDHVTSTEAIRNSLQQWVFGLCVDTDKQSVNTTHEAKAPKEKYAKGTFLCKRWVWRLQRKRGWTQG